MLEVCHKVKKRKKIDLSITLPKTLFQANTPTSCSTREELRFFSFLEFSLPMDRMVYRMKTGHNQFLTIFPGWQWKHKFNGGRSDSIFPVVEEKLPFSHCFSSHTRLVFFATSRKSSFLFPQGNNYHLWPFFVLFFF